MSSTSCSTVHGKPHSRLLGKIATFSGRKIYLSPYWKDTKVLVITCLLHPLLQFASDRFEGESVGALVLNACTRTNTVLLVTNLAWHLFMICAIKETHNIEFVYDVKKVELKEEQFCL